MLVMGVVQTLLTALLIALLIKTMGDRGKLPVSFYFVFCILYYKGESNMSKGDFKIFKNENEIHVEVRDQVTGKLLSSVITSSDNFLHALISGNRVVCDLGEDKEHEDKVRETKTIDIIRPAREGMSDSYLKAILRPWEVDGWKAILSTYKDIKNNVGKDRHAARTVTFERWIDN